MVIASQNISINLDKEVNFCEGVTRGSESPEQPPRGVVYKVLVD